MRDDIRRVIREIRVTPPSLTLLPPGARKGTRFWYVRGTINGRRIEVSTKTTDKRRAERFVRQLVDRLTEPGKVVEIARNPGEVVMIRKWLKPVP